MALQIEKWIKIKKITSGSINKIIWGENSKIKREIENMIISVYLISYTEHESIIYIRFGNIIEINKR